VPTLRALEAVVRWQSQAPVRAAATLQVLEAAAHWQPQVPALVGAAAILQAAGAAVHWQPRGPAMAVAVARWQPSAQPEPAQVATRVQRLVPVQAPTAWRDQPRVGRRSGG
jgi:hypothetical protein